MPMTFESFTPGMLREASVPHYGEVNGQDIDAVKVRIKLFDRDSGWIWYVCGACMETGTCFGFEYRGAEASGEIAYFQLRDLNSMIERGVKIQRAKDWNPQTSLAEVIEERVR